MCIKKTVLVILVVLMFASAVNYFTGTSITINGEQITGARELRNYIYGTASPLYSASHPNHIGLHTCCCSCIAFGNLHYAALSFIATRLSVTARCHSSLLCVQYL